METSNTVARDDGAQFSTFYEVLGVAPSASVMDVRKAYKERALKVHPDKHLNSHTAEEVFKQLHQAYAVLLDPVQRRDYDDRLRLRAANTAATKMTGDQSSGGARLAYRVSDTMVLSEDFQQVTEEDEAEGKDNKNVKEYVMECRCGGEYVVAVIVPSSASSAQKGGERFVYSECTDCSLVIKVML